jgi:hypothetical protein
MPEASSSRPICQFQCHSVHAQPKDKLLVNIRTSSIFGSYKTLNVVLNWAKTMIHRTRYWIFSTDFHKFSLTLTSHRLYLVPHSSSMLGNTFLTAARWSIHVRMSVNFHYRHVSCHKATECVFSTVGRSRWDRWPRLEEPCVEACWREMARLSIARRVTGQTDTIILAVEISYQAVQLSAYVHVAFASDRLWSIKQCC